MAARSYTIVTLVFGVLAATFLLSTASIISEFRDSGLTALLTSSSYLFVFFPTLGIVALVAFYIPAVVFTDIYLTKARLGPLRFGIGFAVVVALSLFFARDLDQTKLRSIWEASPRALAADRASGAHCLSQSGLCTRPILDVVDNLRDESLKRVRISPFIRTCTVDPLLEGDPQNAVARYCFPAGRLLNAEQCCRVSQAFASRVHTLWADEATRSRAATLDRILLPFKAFFIIVILLIGIFLIVWKRTLNAHYGPNIRAMERGLQIGAVAMLFWPIMDYAYQQTLDVLYGPRSTFPVRLSLVMVPWTLLVTFYFADKIRIELARAGQIVGGLASAVAFFRYQDISDWSSKLVGLGAPILHFIMLGVLALIILAMLAVWLAGTFRGEDARDVDDVPPSGKPESRPHT